MEIFFSMKTKGAFFHAALTEKKTMANQNAANTFITGVYQATRNPFNWEA